jgi:hypothetical protein
MRNPFSAEYRKTWIGDETEFEITMLRAYKARRAELVQNGFLMNAGTHDSGGHAATIYKLTEKGRRGLGHAELDTGVASNRIHSFGIKECYRPQPWAVRSGSLAFLSLPSRGFA